MIRILVTNQPIEARPVGYFLSSAFSGSLCSSLCTWYNKNSIKIIIKQKKRLLYVAMVESLAKRCLTWFFKLQAAELLPGSNIFSWFRLLWTAAQIRDCWINKTERGLIMSQKTHWVSSCVKKRKWERTEGEGVQQNKQSKQVWRELAGVTGFSKTFQSLRNKRPCECTGAETRGL